MTNFEKVQQFMECFGQQSDPNILKPTANTLNLLRLRMSLIGEEFRETVTASRNYNQIVDDIREDYSTREMQELTIEWLDGLTDLLYVVYGAFAAFGFDADEAFDIVHKSNMSKLAEDNKPIYRDDGKVLKGPNFCLPDLSILLKEGGTNG